MTRPWRVIPKSSRRFESNNSLAEISKQLEHTDLQVLAKLKKLIISEINDDLIQFEPEGKSVFQPICTIKKLEDNAYLYQVGIAKGMLHACIISSLFLFSPILLPEATILYSPVTFFIYIPLLWILLIGIIWTTSYATRKQIQLFIQEKVQKKSPIPFEKSNEMGE
jgi:hypothetical protein